MGAVERAIGWVPSLQLSNIVNLGLIVLNNLRKQECKTTQTHLQRIKSLLYKQTTFSERKLYCSKM